VKPTGAVAALMLGLLTVATACTAGGQDESATSSASTASAGATEPSLAAAAKDGVLTVPSGERLHYRCQGAGSPAIILEAGGGAGTEEFPSQFIDPLAEVTTVCTYDRPGAGSSSGPTGNHARAGDDQCDVEDGLIAGLGLEAPYVLMGQSAGGNLVIWCASRHPRKVAALVTIEAYHDDPAEMKKQDFGWQGNPDHVDYIEATTELDRMKMPIGTFPVLVFSATQADPGGAQNQRYWLGLSPHSRQVVVEGGHDLHIDAPDQLTREILDLLAGLGATGADGTQ
jgi:pimeloyl-ACP methyl ester carboxylesterase